MATLSEIRDEVLSNTGRGGGGSGDKTDKATKGINRGLQHIARRQDWKDLRTSATTSTNVPEDDTFITLETDYLRLLEFRWIDSSSDTGDELYVASKEDVLKRFTINTVNASSKPVAAYEEQGLLHLIPPADGTYRIDYTYIKRPDTLADDSDTPDINDVEDVLEAFATAYVFKSVQAYEDANQWQGTFIGLLERAIQEDAKRPAQLPQFRPWTRHQHSLVGRDLLIFPGRFGELWHG